MSKINILVVEDEERLRRLVGDYLKVEGYSVIEAENGKIGLEIFNKEKIDLVILDIMLPEYDGWTVCREIRKVSDVPIIMLTARSEESDQLFGFELGADEYVTKPFSPKVLVARVKALLKRLNENISDDQNIYFNGLKINEAAHKVYIDEEHIDLSPKEYDILLYLVKNKGRALSRDQILDSVWGFDYYGDERTVDTHIKRLRIKLKEKSDYIQTVRGLGYRFEGNEEVNK
ncbi:response regulator transcription factor [Sporosalibacterium faouarense]|uniref:response regulator transcription factor n=1 Tax=Sporosalibacterium faouarense TaxID=516123 RepID=UPI00192B5FF5|nr:response regulator transcription factor [Sporosalibacterium faouarense]